MTAPILGTATLRGAPVLNNAAGSLLDLLRAYLVTGFNTKAVSSIDVVAGVATAACADHGFLALLGVQVLISGASAPELNGQKQLTSAATNSFTFAAPGVPDGSYAGGITAKTPGMGWSELYTAGGKSVFGRTDPLASAQLLLINDSHDGTVSTATDARATMLEGATGIDAYTSPKSASGTAGTYWSKGSNTATAKNYIIVGTSRGFFLATTTSPNTWAHLMYFGDIKSYLPSDPYRSVLAGSSAATGGGTPTTRSNHRFAIGAQAFGADSPVICRPRTGVDVPNFGRVVALIGADAAEGGSVGQTDYAYTPIVRPVIVTEQDTTAGHPARGEIAGMASAMGNLPYANGQVVSTDDGYNYIALRTANGTARGLTMVSLNDDWY